MTGSAGPGAGNDSAGNDSAGRNSAGSKSAGNDSAGRNNAGRGAAGGRPQAEPGAAPVLTVIRGDATAEEIAALVAVLAAKASARPAPRELRVPGWASRPAMLRRPLSHGPGAWRASGRPG